LSLSDEIVGEPRIAHFGNDVGKRRDGQDCVRSCGIEGASTDNGGGDDESTDCQIASDSKQAGNYHRSPKPSSWARSEYHESACGAGTTKPAGHLSNFDIAAAVQQEFGPLHTAPVPQKAKYEENSCKVCAQGKPHMSARSIYKELSHI
jgi:hypothetical protein